MENLSEDEVRKMVREMIMSGELSEYDALYPKEKNWETVSTELRTLIIDLLKNIENDEYYEGLEKIDSVIYKLKVWRHKIEKFLN